MKKIILWCLLITYVSLEAQVSIGRTVSPTNLYIRDIDDKYFDFLDQTITYFVVPESLDYEATKKIISDVWTYNKINFIAETDYDENNLMEKGNTIIRIHDKGYQMVRDRNGYKTTVNSWFAYKFELISYYNVEVKKKGKKDPDILKLAEVFFTQSMHNRYEMQPSYNKKAAKEISDEPDFYNFFLGYIKNYFQILNKGLMDRKKIDLTDKVIDQSKMVLLKEKTLYAPQWILKRVAPFTGKLKSIDKAEELFEDYNYKYKLLSYDDLNNKILSGDDFYYLMNTQFNEHQILSIINSVTGEVIYSSERKSYNINDKDLKEISQAISMD
ncbi:MAG: hypothetical protein R2797_07330 [Gelidibacter sp.]